MPKQVITPKFLAEDTVEFVVKSVWTWLTSSNALSTLLKRKEGCVVVLVPAIKDDRGIDDTDWTALQLQPHCICNMRFGDKTKWEHPFDGIAMCKALQLWDGRNDGRNGPIAHLLFPGDTPYYGGVKREGLVVAVSGLQSYFDQMVAGVITDILIGLAAHKLATSEERLNNRDFLV